ncbi:DUF1559 family PulG-like putative transporter [Allorhodopirellula solitaria]|uniref:DUF1559 domain-containing protein n=1 Tax=Allorhodopirellula solitaria TaxID=2527987 RepID=A0A5C5YK03_9BACT|nr:DUF1559 domain-containing protein [Allorhodopirellula solitaria]TWT75235.1 hypothetical protein CA85_05240 [Allorhodopirellula solitaria]
MMKWPPTQYSVDAILTRGFVSLLLLTAAIASAPAMEPVQVSSESSGEADEILRHEEDGWKEYDSPRGRLLRRELTIYPAAVNAASDSIRLLPEDEEMRDANAALWYLQAMGFLEQTAARQAMERFHSEQAEQRATNASGQAAPWIWLETAPDELPIAEVREYLTYSRFQRRLMHRAARCRNFDLDRNIYEMDDLYGFLIPEIQALRQLSRNQTLRARLAIADQDFATARITIGENLQLAHHLSAEPFVVSTLVGISIARSSFDDAVYLVAEPDSPNLYQAIAALPNPLVDPTRAVELEMDMLFHQVRPLREIGVTPLSDQDWSKFLQAVLPMLGHECELVERFQDSGLLGATLFIAAAGREVEAYLLNECGVTTEQFTAMPATQSFFLAVRRMYEASAQEALQLYRAPASVQADRIARSRERRDRNATEYPMLHDTIGQLILNTALIVQPRWRLQQRLAILQTVEAIRDHLATHDSQWPERLSDLALPAPHDPVSGEPMAWSIKGDAATLTARPVGGEVLEIVLRKGETEKPGSDTSSPLPTPQPSGSQWHSALQIDEQPTNGWLLSDRTLGKLSPTDRGVWKALQRKLNSVPGKEGAVGQELLADILAPLLPQAGNLHDAPPQAPPSQLDASLQPGLDAVSDYPIRWVVSVPRSFRQVFAEVQPAIDQDSAPQHSLGWIEHVRWVGIGVDPDEGIVQTIVQCRGEDSAAKVQDQLPHLVLAMYRHWVDPAADELPATEREGFASVIVGDRVTFTAGGGGEDDDGIVRLIRLLSVGYQSSLNARIKAKMAKLLLATHNYHSAYDRLPPFAQFADNTQRLGLSWRVFLLPFVGESELFEKFRLDEPWDSEHNLALVKEIPEVYQNPLPINDSDPQVGQTTLLAPAGTSARFLGGQQEHGFRHISDGLSNTVAIVEVRPELAVPWTQPADYVYDNQDPVAGLMTRDGKTVIALGDGWTGIVPIDQGDDNWRGMFTINGREPIRVDLGDTSD